MEIEEIRQELNELLENVVDHSSRYNAERPIPSLEISFVLSKINKMQENFSILKYLLEQQEKRSKQIKRDSKVRALSIEEDTIEQEVEEKRIDQVETAKVIVSVENLQEGQVVNEPVNIERTSISKLTDALTLNDRYLYANELFNKDMNAFNEFVKSIDSSLSLNEATALCSTLGWDNENEHVMSFTNLVERRFS